MKFSSPSTIVRLVESLHGQSIAVRISTRWNARLGRLGYTVDRGGVSVQMEKGVFDRLAL